MRQTCRWQHTISQPPTCLIVTSSSQPPTYLIGTSSIHATTSPSPSLPLSAVPPVLQLPASAAGVPSPPSALPLALSHVMAMVKRSVMVYS